MAGEMVVAAEMEMEGDWEEEKEEMEGDWEGLEEGVEVGEE